MRQPRLDTQHKATQHFINFVEVQAAKAEKWKLDDAGRLGFLAGEATGQSITVEYLVYDRPPSYKEDHDKNLPATRLKDHTIRFNLHPEQAQDMHPNVQTAAGSTEYTLDLDNCVEFRLRGKIQSKTDFLDISVLTNKLIELETEEHLQPVVG